MGDLNAFLIFNGNCAEAMRFYERTLGGKLEALMTHAQSPEADQTPPGQADKIIYSRLAIDRGVLMGMDAPASKPYEGMKGFLLSLAYPTAGEAKGVFDALAKGGKVTMPLQKTFYAETFGMLADRFGTPWMISGAMTTA